MTTTAAAAPTAASKATAAATPTAVAAAAAALAFALAACSTSPPSDERGSSTDSKLETHALAPPVEPPSPRGLDAWDGRPETEDDPRVRPVVGLGGMVSADDRAAAEWGAEILRRGGNAIDAAVATAFYLSVTRPNYASLGGGGFLLFCPKPEAASQAGGASLSPKCQVIDYRETAPARASRDMYVRDGKGRTDLSQDGALASGVPGVTAGLLLALEKFGSGKLARGELLKKPIEAARRGFRFSGHLEGDARYRWKAMSPAARAIFGCRAKPEAGATPPSRPDELAACPEGTLIRQPDLARVLEEIARQGKSGFYEGWVGKKIVEGFAASGGILEARDLSGYEPKLRDPISARFRFGGAQELEVVSMPPPSSGGAIVLQLLRYAELADRSGELSEGYGSSRALHALAHSMTLAFADRAKHFGDPDTVKVPLAGLLAQAYLEERWKSFDPGRAVPVPSAGEPPAEGAHTTHFSVIDREGNAVAVTTTINDTFGSGFVPPGTGIVMNNEMDDFSIQPGVPNLYGLVGAEANAIAPGKRPLSSMSPTIVRDGSGLPRIAIGAQGGPRIPTSVFQALLNRLRFGMAISDAVHAPRIHTQWKPADLLHEEQGFLADTRRALAGMGYSLKPTRISGRIHAVERFPATGRVWGVVDPRAEGGAVAE